MTALPDPTAAKRILICEDDPNLRTLIRLAVGNGFEFLEAPDGDAALELLRSAHPDLVVLDLMLPGRSGLDLLAEIRAGHGFERTPVVVISAWSHADAEAVAAGADRFVAKPFDPAELHAAVVDLLEQDERDR
jgi:two-component system, OmpR family, response regulator